MSGTSFPESSVMQNATPVLAPSVGLARRALLPFPIAAFCWGTLLFLPWLAEPAAMANYLARQITARQLSTTTALSLLQLLASAYLMLAAAMSWRRTGKATARAWLAPAATATLLLFLVSIGHSLWQAATGRYAIIKAPVQAWPYFAGPLPTLAVLAVTALLLRNRQAALALSAPRNALVTPAYEMSALRGLQYFSPVTSRGDDQDQIDPDAALAHVARAIGTLALVVGVTRCISFLIAHGGLNQGPYQMPWSYHLPGEQLRHWGELAADAGGPLLVIGGGLALKLRTGAWRFVGTGAALLLSGLVIQMLARWPIRAARGASPAMIVTYYLASDVRQLIPAALLLSVVAQRAVRALRAPATLTSAP